MVTHADHARLAGAFATAWGNELFAPPTPRASVLHAIHVHDDGWALRDAAPSITREGKPAAFSVELVGKYSAFEEIDLADYLDVRERAVEQVEARDAYAALLVSKHTYNLLTERADRSTIPPGQLPLLDAFLERQEARQERLLAAVRADARYTADEGSDEAVERNFRLLQACDNLSLLACVAYTEPATLLHPLARRDGSDQPVAVHPTGEREFRLTPFPLEGPGVFILPARHVEGHTFATAGDLRERYAAAPVEHLKVTSES